MAPTPPPGTTRADALILGALRELRTALPASSDVSRAVAAVAAGDNGARRQRQQHSLARALAALADGRQARGLHSWRTFYAVDRATQPIEDELVVTKRELRRAHGNLQAVVSQGL